MFWRGNTYKKMKLKRELKAVNKEISRSKRYGYHFGVLVLQVDNSIPRGLSKTLPGRPISCHVLESHLRYHDCLMLGNFFRTYFIILPQTPIFGVLAVKRRLDRLAREHSWGSVRMGTAAYPEDGDDAKILLEISIEDACP